MEKIRLLKMFPKLEAYRGALSAKAFDSGKSRGRLYSSEENPGCTAVYGDDPFAVDAQKIFSSELFGRSAKKTQVFPVQTGLTNRRSHAVEVAYLASEICGLFGLNEPLARAIAFGHDVGYTPFGSAGVDLLTSYYGKKFKHALMSAAALQMAGCNLSYEVLEGIENHSFGKKEFSFPKNLSQEARVVAIVDKFAFVFGDIGDAFVIGHLLFKGDAPDDYFNFGTTKAAKWRRCLKALIEESAEAGEISFGKSEVSQRFNTLRDWSYCTLYKSVDQGRDRIKDGLGLAFAFLKDYLSGTGSSFDPVTVFALMTDSEISELLQALRCTERCGSRAPRSYLSGIYPLKLLKGLSPESRLDPFTSTLGAFKKS